MQTRVRDVSILLMLLSSVGVAASETPAPKAPPAKSGELTLCTIPERKIPEPEARSKPYPVPPTNWEQRPVLWGWTCELPDGSGLAFGGVDQSADDGNPHTRIKDGSNWKPIVEDLRKNNPLQKYVANVRNLRNDCKDALARARSIYFDGHTPDEESKLLKRDFDAAAVKLGADLPALLTELKALKGLSDYDAAQVAFASKHLLAAAPSIKPSGGKITPEQMATLRLAQIELEIAGEAFDAEPSPRSLSLIAYEPKSKLYVIFGGDHMDYQTNDLWAFDPAKKKWFQRHPDAAPEPRGDHHFDALGDGRIAMRGGYVYDKGYVHVGPERWIYDVAKNVWSADGHSERTLPADSRSKNFLPPAVLEDFMKGPRPDAAANEAKLKALPVNTWVQCKTAIPLGGRDWGSWCYDEARDMLYVWAGGHASYGGNDVARYHMSTDRWEVTDPAELPLGGVGTNEQYPAGVTYSQRPWVKKHTWNSKAFDPVLKKMLVVGTCDPKLDPYYYTYDPDKSDWVSRARTPEGMGNGAGQVQLRYTKHGLFNWCGENNVWLLDDKTMEWKRMTLKGTLPAPSIDSCGMVYDGKHDRMIFNAPGYGVAYNGQLYALDFATSQVTALNPEGMDDTKTWWFFGREAVYHPESDMIIYPVRYCKDKNCHAPPLPNHFPCYDIAKNRWVVVKFAVEPDVTFPGVSGYIVYDAKRGLIWSGDSAMGSGVCVLRFDATKAEIVPMKSFVAPTIAGK